ncbi:hypothetical protein CSB20_01855 [bacterium DOLZORAL124_64_63]|nr:MAG: hypothetical protein CSB20_01855 [bacterium DOLZORAL124_64_63]
MALWDDVKKNLVEWYTVTSEKTSEAARIGTRRWDKFGISRDIERQFSELGNLVYSGLKEGREEILESAEFQQLVHRIENLEEELKHKDEEIERIRDEYKRETSRAAGQAAAAEGGAGPEGAKADFGEDEGGSATEPSESEPAEREPAELGATVSETILSGPVLDQGGEDSAILVEPEVVPEESVPPAEEDPKKDGI